MRRYAGLIVLFLLAIAGLFLRDHQTTPQKQAPPPQSSTPQAKPKPAPQAKPASSAGLGYILALTWSPAFCAAEDPSGTSDQCEIGARNGLLVHGLWPENRAGASEYCDTSEPDRIPDDIARRLRGLMPDMGLARHEWKKHGSCSGLSQRAYFETMERAFRAFRIPSSLTSLRNRQTMARDALLGSITQANTGLPGRAISLQCGKGGVLSEIRLCLDGNLGPVACETGMGRGCPGTVTLLPPQ